jgi:acetamidase/formamidase
MSSPDVVSLDPTPDQYAYAFGGREPLLTVRPGTIVELSTEDCYAGNVTSADDLPSEVCHFPFLNPVTGPIAVEGAEPGDTLVVHFVDIQPARDWAVSSTFPLFGALTATHSTALLHEALEERVWMYEIDRAAGTCRYRARRSDFTVDLPLDPMHGTVGVAPAANEVLMSITPATHGGNMDTPEMRAGTTAYFGVNVEGGLLSIGDGHARQGEGAYRISQLDLVRWTGSLLGLDDLDAYQLVSQAGLAPAGNVCDTNYTMVGKLPKSLLGSVSAYDGVHDRLRTVGEEYLRGR